MHWALNPQLLCLCIECRSVHIYLCVALLTLRCAETELWSHAYYTDWFICNFGFLLWSLGEVCGRFLTCCPGSFRSIFRTICCGKISLTPFLRSHWNSRYFVVVFCFCFLVLTRHHAMRFWSNLEEICLSASRSFLYLLEAFLEAIDPSCLDPKCSRIDKIVNDYFRFSVVARSIGTHGRRWQ